MERMKLDNSLGKVVVDIPDPVLVIHVGMLSKIRHIANKFHDQVAVGPDSVTDRLFPGQTQLDHLLVEGFLEGD